MFCRNCGARMNSNQAICLRCGVKTGTGNAFCSNCGQAIAPGAVVCVGCGVAVGRAPNPNGRLGNYDKATVALVCFFFGYFGLHNFLIGETKKGITKLIATCFLFGWILTFIDFIKILTNSYVVDPDKWF